MLHSDILNSPNRKDFFSLLKDDPSYLPLVVYFYTVLSVTLDTKIQVTLKTVNTRIQNMNSKNQHLFFGFSRSQLNCEEKVIIIMQELFEVFSGYVAFHMRVYFNIINR